MSHTDAGYGFEKISPQGDLFLIFFKIYLSVYFFEHIIQKDYKRSLEKVTYYFNWNVNLI